MNPGNLIQCMLIVVVYCIAFNVKNIFCYCITALKKVLLYRHHNLLLGLENCMKIYIKHIFPLLPRLYKTLSVFVSLQVKLYFSLHLVL